MNKSVYTNLISIYRFYIIVISFSLRFYDKTLTGHDLFCCNLHKVDVGSCNCWFRKQKCGLW